MNGITAIAAFIFWTASPSAVSRLIVRVTGRQLADRSDVWSHMGIGFVFNDLTSVYYEAFFSQGFSGPKPLAKLLNFENAGGRLHRQTVKLRPGGAEIKRRECETWVGKRGYYALQLAAMWACERLGTRVRETPNRVVCSEAVARLLYPEIDLRDSRRTRFDEVNPNSAYRRFKAIEWENHAN